MELKIESNWFSSLGDDDTREFLLRFMVNITIQIRIECGAENASLDRIRQLNEALHFSLGNLERALAGRLNSGWRESMVRTVFANARVTCAEQIAHLWLDAKQTILQRPSPA